jgi:hypothetical protein
VQQRRFIADLEAQLDQSSKRIKELDRKRAKELKDHEKYRDSVMRRFAYKAAGKKDKFESKAQKEETEYFDVLQQELREKNLNEKLATQLSEANEARVDLEQQADQHAAMQRELDALYDAIFSGPTPDFPEEDAKEGLASAALAAYQDCRNRSETQAHAARLLAAGQQHMRGALASMESALRHSRADMFGGGTFSDMMERSALQRADAEVQAARMLVLQAQRMAPGVADLPPVDINQGHLMRDVFFDNIFTDMAFHDEIKRAAAEVQRAAFALDRQLDAAGGRAAVLGSELGQREKDLQEARAALQKARENAFEKVAGT